MHRFQFASAAVLLTLCLGCSSKTEAPKSADDLAIERDLFAIGNEYHAFYEANKRSPKNAEEFIAFESTEKYTEEQEHIPELLESGKYIVVWNADLMNYETPQGEKLLAYVRDAADGGYVCYQNTAILKVTPKKFAEAARKTKAIDSD